MAHRGTAYLAQRQGTPRMTTVQIAHPMEHRHGAVSIPAIVVNGHWSVAELVNFKVGFATDPRNVDMVMAVSEKASKRGESK